MLNPPPGPAAPGAFDFARKAYFQRLGGVGYAVGHLEPVPPAASDTASPGLGEAWELWWSDLRVETARRILAVLPGERGAIAAALMTGERGAIPPAVVDAMRDSGLAHLLAISGLHMGLVAGLLFSGLRWGFGLYLVYFPTYKAVYGTISAIPVFLTWMYLVWVLILSGAIFVRTLGLTPEVGVGLELSKSLRYIAMFRGGPCRRREMQNRWDSFVTS